MLHTEFVHDAERRLLDNTIAPWAFVNAKTQRLK